MNGFQSLSFNVWYANAAKGCSAEAHSVRSSNCSEEIAPVASKVTCAAPIGTVTPLLPAANGWKVIPDTSTGVTLDSSASSATTTSASGCLPSTRACAAR